MGTHFPQILALRTPDEATSWATFHLPRFLDYLGNATDPNDERLRRHRIYQLYVELIGLYYQFREASNFGAVANMWGALLQWKREFNFQESIEVTADSRGKRPAIPKPF
jgi:hypothetical protein